MITITLSPRQLIEIARAAYAAHGLTITDAIKRCDGSIVLTAREQENK